MGNSNFNENTRVQVPAALHLCKLGYTYLDNINAYDTKTNILIDVFLNAVKRLNPSLSSQEVSLLFSKIVNVANNDDLGREFYQMLSSNSGIKLIDFDNPETTIGTSPPSLLVKTKTQRTISVPISPASSMECHLLSLR